MDIVKLLILILKLIVELHECIRNFISGGQTVVGNNFTGGDGTTDNQMGIKLQNADDNSIVASVEASASPGNGVHAKSTLSLLYYIITSELNTGFFFFFFLRVSSVR